MENKRGEAWTHSETVLLIELWGDRRVQEQSENTPKKNHADIYFYNNMFTVTQVFKSDRFSIYCSVNVPFALSNVNANRSFLDRFK